MPSAIVLREHGGPAALKLEPIAVGEPGPAEVRVRQTAIGVNFHDIYVRNGLYRTLTLPDIPGIEAVGVVEAVGAGVTGLRPGMRIGYFTGSYGAYASERLLPAELAFALPTSVNNQTAASMLVRGLTVEMLTGPVHRVGRGDRIARSRGPPGVCREAAMPAAPADLGAVVISAATGSARRATIARAAGCQEVILYRDEDFVARVRTFTDGRGVDVAYDSVGKDTFMGSLACPGALLRGQVYG